MCAASPPTTPKSSRSFLGRILRSHTKSKRSPEEKEEPKITGFFNIRKRLSPTYDNKPEASRKRRGVIITDAHAKTPAESYPVDSPPPSYDSQFDDVDSAPSPPTRPRVPTPLGVFDMLGEFERFDFLASLPISFYIKLALTSREWAENIINYLNSKTWKKRFVISANNYVKGSSEEDPFANTGQLIKAVTISKRTEERINLAIGFIESVHEDLNNANGWFRFLYNFCHLWQANEKKKVWRAVKSMNGENMDTLLKVTLTARHGEKLEAEMELRKLFHAYFINPLLADDSTVPEKREASFWLSCALKTVHKVSMQGRLCMIIFAPLMTVNGKGQIHWYTLVNDVVISAEDARARLAPLTTGISALVSSREQTDFGFCWKQDEIFNLLEEITTFPDPWSFDNFVSFLIQRGNILPIAVCTRINHNHRDEAGQIVNTIKTLMFRWGIDTTVALGRPFRYILNALNNQHRESFVLSVLDAHQSQCREYLLLGDAGRSSYEEETFAQLAFSTLFNEAISRIR